jgi:hypothetical protein
LCFTDQPSKPGTPEIKNFDKDFVELEWTRPSEDGGSPITGYVIEKKDKFRCVFTYFSRLDMLYVIYILLLSMMNEKYFSKLHCIVTHEDMSEMVTF